MKQASLAKRQTILVLAVSLSRNSLQPGNTLEKRLRFLYRWMLAWWMSVALGVGSALPVAADNCCILYCINITPGALTVWDDCVICHCRDEGEPCSPVAITVPSEYPSSFTEYSYLYRCDAIEGPCINTPDCGDMVPYLKYTSDGYSEIEQAILSGYCDSSPATVPCTDCVASTCVNTPGYWYQLDKEGECQDDLIPCD